MRVLVFGNPLHAGDSLALKVAKKLAKKLPEFQFVPFDTAEDLEEQGEELVILDAAKGIKAPAMLHLSDLELQKSYSLHDFDLAWNLTLLAKLGKIRDAKIIALPYGSTASSCEKGALALLLSILPSKSASRSSCKGRKRG
jgi:Ni,Fe-hydrogenase maturation factor